MIPRWRRAEWRTLGRKGTRGLVTKETAMSSLAKWMIGGTRDDRIGDYIPSRWKESSYNGHVRGGGVRGGGTVRANQRRRDTGTLNNTKSYLENIFLLPTQNNNNHL